MGSVEIVLALVVLATVVAVSAGRLSIPAPSLLVLAGLIAGLVPGVPEVRVTPAVVSLVGAAPAAVRGGPGVVAAGPAGRVAAGGGAGDRPGAGLGRRRRGGGVRGDPVAGQHGVRAGRGAGQHRPGGGDRAGPPAALPARVRALVQAESLFNDATSLVLFRVAVSFAAAAVAGGWAGGIGRFAVLAGGGVAARR